MRITPPTHSTVGGLNEAGKNLSKVLNYPPLQSQPMTLPPLLLRISRPSELHFLISFFLLKNSSLSTPFFLSPSRGSILPPPVFHFHLHSLVNPLLPPPGHCHTLQHLSQALLLNSTVAWLMYCLPHSLECKLHEDFMPYSCCIPSK